MPPVSHGGFWNNFLFYVACQAALFALGKLDTFPLPSYLSALVRCLGVACGALRFGFFGRSCVLLGSTVDTCSSRGSGRISHIFYVAANSNPEVLLSLLLQNRQACPVDASGCSSAQRGSHLENWNYFYEFHAAEMLDDGQHF